jgi:hypothetical protein
MIKCYHVAPMSLIGDHGTLENRMVDILFPWHEMITDLCFLLVATVIVPF